jgi:hypothetical protein
VHVPGWKIIGQQVHTGYREHALKLGSTVIKQESSNIVFNLNCIRKGIRHLLLVILPLILIYLTVLLCLLLGFATRHQSMIEITGASLAALIAYRFVLESLSPNVGYFMLADHVYFLFLAASFVIYLLILLPSYLSQHTRGILVLLLQLTIAILWYYYFNIWLR